MSYGGWFVLNIAVGMLQFYSGRSILLITRLNNSLGLFTICDKRQLERKATCSLVTLKPIYLNNPAKGWLKRYFLGKIQILNLMKKYYLEFRTHFLRFKFECRSFARENYQELFKPFVKFLMCRRPWIKGFFEGINSEYRYLVG